jgi:predicted metal-dependent HD superfamily phosphohydrolase
MGVYDAPQWLLSAWSACCKEAGATASPDEVRATGQRLIERWSEPGRHFHNIKHLVHVLSRVDELAEETHEPDLVRLAAWYHGAIFDAAEKAAYANRGGEDEVASAELARTELLQLGVPQKKVDRVVHLVTALARHTAAPGDFDCAVLCDADMAMLAAEPQRYKSYLKDVRAEYAHVPVEDYLRARSAILTKLQQRPSLFASPLGAAWEESARQNVGAELHRIRKELAALDAASASGDGEASTSGTANGAPSESATGATAGSGSATGATAGSGPATGATPVSGSANGARSGSESGSDGAAGSGSTGGAASGRGSGASSGGTWFTRPTLRFR